jgi:hypothetical protein
MCAHDSEWYCENDMVSIDGDWVAADNEESYLLQLKQNQDEQERETITA